MSARTPSLAKPESSAPEALLSRLDWQILRRLEGQLQGDYRTVFLGEGLDVSDLREYQPDDDVRRIDWNVTARMHTPFVRQYEEDRDVTAWFLVDRSLSMQFGHGERTKETVVAELTVALSRLLSNRGNRVGAMLWSNALDAMLQPRTGKPQVLRLAKHLLSAPPAIAAANVRDTTLTELLSAANGIARRRSLVFVISDFVGAPGWDVELRRLSVLHEVIAIRVTDPQEHALPDAGLVVVQDAETGEQMTVDTGNAKFRERFEAAAAAREQAITDESVRAGVDLFRISTTDDVARKLLEMVAHRKGRRGR